MDLSFSPTLKNVSASSLMNHDQRKLFKILWEKNVITPEENCNRKLMCEHYFFLILGNLKYEVSTGKRTRKYETFIVIYIF